MKLPGIPPPSYRFVVRPRSSSSTGESMKQIDDPWNPCFGGRISNVGACWIRISDGHCFSVVGHADDEYTLERGDGFQIRVATIDLPEQFRPT